MPDIEKVIKAIDICLVPDVMKCEDCPYLGKDDKELELSCVGVLMKDAGILLKEYHKADGFLAVHGWNGWSLQKTEER